MTEFDRDALKAQIEELFALAIEDGSVTPASTPDDFEELNHSMGEMYLGLGEAEVSDEERAYAQECFDAVVARFRGQAGKD